MTTKGATSLIHRKRDAERLEVIMWYLFLLTDILNQHLYHLQEIEKKDSKQHWMIEILSNDKNTLVANLNKAKDKVLQLSNENQQL